KLKRLELVAPGPNKHANVVVPNNHVADVDGLEAIEGLSDFANPGVSVATSVLGDEVEYGGMRLVLELEGLQVGKLVVEPTEAGGIADGNGHVLPRERVNVVPISYKYPIN
ncbi:hypothetical protein MUK42_17177, partial [Musa troglodytarum]